MILISLWFADMVVATTGYQVRQDHFENFNVYIGWRKYWGNNVSVTCNRIAVLCTWGHRLSQTNGRMSELQATLQASFAIPQGLAKFMQGIQKLVYGKMMWTLGLNYTKHMNPKLTKVVVSTDVTDGSSAKVNAAHELGLIASFWIS